MSKALALPCSIALLIAAFYVAFSEAVQQFGFLGIAPAAFCGIVLIRKGTGPWVPANLVGVVLGTAAFAGYAANIMN